MRLRHALCMAAIVAAMPGYNAYALYSIQVFASDAESEARSFAANITQYQPITVTNVDLKWKVRIGNFENQADATTTKNALRSNGFPGAFIVDSSAGSDSVSPQPLYVSRFAPTTICFG
jgi:SPOR domain